MPDYPSSPNGPVFMDYFSGINNMSTFLGNDFHYAPHLNINIKPVSQKYTNQTFLAYLLSFSSSFTLLEHLLQLSTLQ